MYVAETPETHLPNACPLQESKLLNFMHVGSPKQLWLDRDFCVATLTLWLWRPYIYCHIKLFFQLLEATMDSQHKMASNK